MEVRRIRDKRIRRERERNSSPEMEQERTAATERQRAAPWGQLNPVSGNSEKEGYIRIALQQH